MFPPFISLFLVPCDAQRALSEAKCLSFCSLFNNSGVKGSFLYDATLFSYLIFRKGLKITT